MSQIPKKEIPVVGEVVTLVELGVFAAWPRNAQHLDRTTTWKVRGAEGRLEFRCNEPCEHYGETRIVPFDKFADIGCKNTPDDTQASVHMWCHPDDVKAARRILQKTIARHLNNLSNNLSVMTDSFRDLTS